MAQTKPLELGTLSRHTDIAEALRTLTPFGRDTANLRGRTCNGGLNTVWDVGRLNPTDAMQQSLKGAVYVVWSYQTPIAWYADGTWHTNPNRYSASTSRQQSKIYAALSVLR